MTRAEFKERIKGLAFEVIKDRKKSEIAAVQYDELTKFPELKEVILTLLTADFDSFLSSIDWVAPRPTTFRINLKNDQEFYLIWMGRSWIAQVEGKKYYLLNLPEEERAVEAAKKSRCANCVAFDISPRMLECIPGKTSEPVEDEDGILGYCWMHQFKCHSARSCNTWAAGGPINEDKVSYDWQKRNLKAALDPEPIDPDMYKDD